MFDHLYQLQIRSGDGPFLSPLEIALGTAISREGGNRISLLKPSFWNFTLSLTQNYKVAVLDKNKDRNFIYTTNIDCLLIMLAECCTTITLLLS